MERPASNKMTKNTFRKTPTKSSAGQLNCDIGLIGLAVMGQNYDGSLAKDRGARSWL